MAARRELLTDDDIHAEALRIAPRLNGLSVAQALVVLDVCANLIRSGTTFDAHAESFSALSARLQGPSDVPDE